MRNKTGKILFILLLLTSGNLPFNVYSAAQNQANDQQASERPDDEINSSDSATPSNMPPKIYKVVDESGVITFTDKPQPNAEPLSFDGQTQNVVKAAKVPPPPPAPQKAPKPKYKVVIKSPAPEATIRNNLGDLTISAAQTGAPKAPIYRLIFDDAPIASNSSGIFKLSGIHRGAHTYKVELINNTGKTLASSPVQTLYLHQASALINN